MSLSASSSEKNWWFCGKRGYELDQFHVAKLFLSPWTVCKSSQNAPYHALRRAKVQYHTQNLRPLVPTLNYNRSVHPFYPISCRSILILSSHLLLCFPNGFCSSSLITTTLHAFLFSPMRAIRPAHLTLLDLITNYIWWARIIQFLVMDISPFSFDFLPRRRNYLPQHLVLEQTQPIFSLKVTDQVPHPYTFK